MGQSVCPAAPLQFRMPLLTPIEPPQCPLHALACCFGRRLPGNHVIECHGNIGRQLPLDLHGAFRGQHPAGTVDMALELNAVFGDAAQALEGEHLKSS